MVCGVEVGTDWSVILLGRVEIALKRADLGLDWHLVSGGDKPDELFEWCEHHVSVGLSIVHEILSSVS